MNINYIPTELISPDIFLHLPKSFRSDKHSTKTGHAAYLLTPHTFKPHTTRAAEQHFHSFPTFQGGIPQAATESYTELEKGFISC